MRIIGGSLRGRALVAPTDLMIRPTSDRLRQSLFNILEHGDYPSLQGARVLDLFAGTGALGFEALSRGAIDAVFVDESLKARALLRENIQNLHLAGLTRIFRRNATELGACAPQTPFNYIFMDPPYMKGLAQKACACVHEQGWVAKDAVIVVEESREAHFKFIDAFQECDRRIYGESQIIIGRYTV